MRRYASFQRAFRRIIVLISMPLLAACSVSSDTLPPPAAEEALPGVATPSVVWSEPLPAASAAPTAKSNVATPVPKLYSLTTGRLLPDGIRRPALLAVIGNAPQVRPQTGLMQADIIYEFVLDRGDTTTRLVALYSDTYPPLAGPIQDARIYFFDLQREYGSMMVYNGYPEIENYPLFNESIIDIPAAYSSALRYLFTRSDTVSSLQENTLFCRVNEMADALYGANGPAVQTRFQFDESVSYKGAKRFLKVGLSFSGKDTGKAEFVYDSERNLLCRYEKNSKGNLAESRTLTYSESGNVISEPIAVQNLIVQYIPYEAMSDSFYSANLIGSGKCDYFVNGTYTPGFWRRETLDGITNYFLRDGSPLVLSPGTTWIAVHSDQRQIKIHYAK